MPHRSKATSPRSSGHAIPGSVTVESAPLPVAAYRLAPGRDAARLHANDLYERGTPHAPVWIHLDRRTRETHDWIRTGAGLDPIVAEALLQEDTRPRVEAFEGGVLVILRGVNLNPGADPEDMISIRCWLEPTRIITLRSYHVVAIASIRERIERGQGPASVSSLFADLVRGLLDRLGAIVVELTETLEQHDEVVETEPPATLRARVGEIRRQAITLRRFAAPQREALGLLCEDPPAWFDHRDTLSIGESEDRLRRYVEDLDALRERCAATHDQLSGRVNEEINRAMYMLTIVAAVMLPLGFVTGLLGVNLSGIPGAGSPWSFAVLCALLAGMIGLEMWILRRVGLL